MDATRRALLSLLAAGWVGAPVRGRAASVLAPQGTLRASYIAGNPVQAFVDPASGAVRGPAAELTAALARGEDVPFTLTGAPGAAGVMQQVTSRAADIGFLAYDPARTAELEFTQTYALAQNTYLVRADSPLRVCADADRPGIRIVVAERDAGDFFLTRHLQHAALVRVAAGDAPAALAMLRDKRADAYAANRQRLSAIAARATDLRLMPDNFYGVEQAIVVRKGEAAARARIDSFLDEARRSGLITGAIARAGLVGVDVAPPPAGPRP